MFRATHRIDIARSPREVFDHVADAGLQRNRNALVRSMEPASDGPLEVGSRWRGDVARIGAMDVELVEYDRPRRAVHVARTWMGEARHVWAVQELAGGSRLVQRGEMRLKGAGWLLAPLMPLIVRRQLRDCAVSLERELGPGVPAGERERQATAAAS